MTLEEADVERWRFAPQPSSVAQARRAVCGHLASAGRGDLVESTELLVSELVTNALVHAGTPIDVALIRMGAGVRVEVSDGSPHPPTPRHYGPGAGTGRGLRLLEELVDDWGVERTDSGKTVWFTLACGPDAFGPHDAHDARRTSPPSHQEVEDAVSVRLVNVPLLLHEAWRQHAESLLRELLLSTLDVDHQDEAIASHAEVSDALAVLAEHIPTSGIAEDATEIMVSAVEPNITHPGIEVPVPKASVAHFATLDRAIRRALVLVADGSFLTPATQPELEGLRRWLCGEVRKQAAGGQPTPWQPLQEPPMRPAQALRWDTAKVDQAFAAQIAADDSDRIVAISEPALDLLGYADRAELVGARLVSIIPERYRQAHLAGFTLHFLTGRSPLLGQAVDVPALRKDGSEVEVRLTVHSEMNQDDRTIFVATLERPPT